MGKKHLSLVIIPHTKTSHRTYSFSKRRLKFFRWTAIVLAVLAVGVTADYLRMRLSLRSIRALEAENLKQKTDLVEYRSSIADLERQIDQFNEYAGKLNIFAGIKSPEVLTNPGVGGPSLGDQVSLPSRTPIPSAPPDVQALSRKAEDVEDNLTTLVRLFDSMSADLASKPSIWPVRGWPSSGFGTRLDPITQMQAFHAGLDIAAGHGNPIVATADGTVIIVAFDRLLGNYIKINHGNGIVTVYGHMSKTLVRPGKKVKRGDVIGQVGRTGKAVGDHVHYEVRINDKAVNPYIYILEEN